MIFIIITNIIIIYYLLIAILPSHTHARVGTHMIRFRWEPSGWYYQPLGSLLKGYFFCHNFSTPISKISSTFLQKNGSKNKIAESLSVSAFQVKRKSETSETWFTCNRVRQGVGSHHSWGCLKNDNQCPFKLHIHVFVINIITTLSLYSFSQKLSQEFWQNIHLCELLVISLITIKLHCIQIQSCTMQKEKKLHI